VPKEQRHLGIFKFQEWYNPRVSTLSNKGPTDRPSVHGITISAGDGLKQKLCSRARGGVQSMTLDVRAFWLIGALATGSCGLLVLIVQKAYPNYLGRALAIFGAANICLSANYFLKFEGAWVGQFFFNVIGAALVTTCLSLEYEAICILKQQRPWTGWIYGPPALVLAVCFWFTFIQRNISIQLIVCDGISMAMMILIVLVLTRKQAGTLSLVDTLAACAYLVLAASSLAAIVDALRSGQFAQEFDFNRSRSIFTYTIAVMAEGMIYPLFLLMVGERLNRALVVQALHDPLTNVYNRRAFEEIAFRELSGASRTGLPLSLLIFDLDHFKEINDQHGHLAGDSALRTAAALLRDSLRDEDYLCRWGGDEFCALLPRAKVEQAEAVAKRVQQSFEGFSFSYAGDMIKMSVSIGIVADKGQTRKLSDLVLRADAALYKAKVTGRNRYAIAPEVSVPLTDLPAGPELRRAGGLPIA
jgi:diguanylate cyclase (GGDEF)-like protein